MRAAYGTTVLRELAAQLKMAIGSGYSVDKLELCRRSYCEYPELLPQSISGTLNRKNFGSPDNDELQQELQFLSQSNVKQARVIVRKRIRNQ